jgi:hypothetical protein
MGQFVETHMFQAFLEDRMRVGLEGLAGMRAWSKMAPAPPLPDGDGGFGARPDDEAELVGR